MSGEVQNVLAAWRLPVPLALSVIITAIVYLRGWRHLRSASTNVIPVWRVFSFLLGVCLIWLAIGSPLALLDEQLLTVHMMQHLLLMTIAPALILMGAPVMPMLHGLPQAFVRFVVGPLFRWPLLPFIGRVLSRPEVCWFAAAAALVGWHVPAAFQAALQTEGWHVAEHSSFMAGTVCFSLW